MATPSVNYRARALAVPQTFGRILNHEEHEGHEGLWGLGVILAFHALFQLDEVVVFPSPMGFGGHSDPSINAINAETVYVSVPDGVWGSF